jgi:hypothetical protein
MKTTIKKILNRKVLCAAVTVFVIFAFGSCAKKIVFPVSTTLPATSAYVTIKKDKNGNYAIVLNMKHTAGPERLQPSKSNYVVWIESAQKGTMNVGRVTISKGMKGSLKVVTPFKPNVVFITAENDPNVTTPGEQVVLRTNQFEL